MTGFVIIPKDVATDIRVMLASIGQPDFLPVKDTPQRRATAERLYRELLTAASAPEQGRPPVRTDADGVRETLENAAVWHDTQDKAISKQPNATVGHNGWMRNEHQEQATLLRAALSKPEGETGPVVAGVVAVPYDDFFAAYRFVPRSKMFPDDCLKTRLRSLLHLEDIAHADEAEAIASSDLLEALKSIVYAFGMNSAEPQDLYRALVNQMERASAVIAQAEGDTAALTVSPSPSERDQHQGETIKDALLSSCLQYLEGQSPNTVSNGIRNSVLRAVLMSPEAPAEKSCGYPGPCGWSAVAGEQA
jgi:hypothetical protein